MRKRLLVLVALLAVVPVRAGETVECRITDDLRLPLRISCDGDTLYYDPLNRMLLDEKLTRAPRSGRFTRNVISGPSAPACAGQLGCVAAALEYCAENRSPLATAMYRVDDSNPDLEYCTVRCASTRVPAIFNTCERLPNSGDDDCTHDSRCNPACGPLPCDCTNECDETDPGDTAR